MAQVMKPDLEKSGMAERANKVALREVVGIVGLAVPLEDSPAGESAGEPA